MELILERKYKKSGYTIGSLSIRKSPPLGGDLEEASFFCNTLEPPIGTPLESVTTGSGKAIPPGTYQIKMHWSQRFQEQLPLLFTPGTNPPRVLGSPSNGGGGGRGSILIHAGNSVRDTRGCILVGKNTRPGKVLQSKDTLNTFINKLRKCERKREEVWIEVKEP